MSTWKDHPDKDNLYACMIPQEGVSQLRASSARNVTDQFGTLLADIHNITLRDAAIAMLGPVMRGTMIDFPYLCKRQDLGADSLIALHESTAASGHRSEVFSLNHWLNVAQNAPDHQPDMPLNLTNWFVVSDTVEGTQTSPQRLPLGASFAALHQQHWKHIDASGSHFFKAQIHDIDAHDCNFSGAIFGAAELQHSEFFQCNFSGADLRAASLHECTLRDVILDGTNLDGCAFHNVTIQHSDLSRLSPAQTAVLARAAEDGSLRFEHCTLPVSLAAFDAARQRAEQPASQPSVLAHRRIGPADEAHAANIDAGYTGFEPFAVIKGDGATREGHVTSDTQKQR